MKRLPEVVCESVVAEAERVLRAGGIEPSKALRQRTVKRTVDELRSVVCETLDPKP